MRRYRWRSYAMFAYTFDAAPPFGLRSVSREFRLRLPGAAGGAAAAAAAAGGSVTTAASGASSSSEAVGAQLPQVRSPLFTTLASVDTSLLTPPPPARALHTKIRGVSGKAQFPIGLSWVGTAPRRGRGAAPAVGAGRPSAPSSSPAPQGCVLLSWGHDDAETYVSSIPLDRLLAPEITTLVESYEDS
jgi:hypothetical protein